jgi:hypothetical protein
MAFCSSVFSNGSVASAMRPRISAPRALAAGLCVAVLAAGCGGGEARRQAHKPAPVLVGFKRWAGSDPAEDDVVVRRNGMAELHLDHGGAGGHFRNVRLTRGEWERLRRVLTGDPLAHPGSPRSGPRVSGAYRYVVYAGGHAVAADGDRLPRRVQPVVDALNGVVDHHAIPDRHSY